MVVRLVSMRTAKEQLPRLAKEVALGVRVTITVHGHPIADLVPHVPEAPGPKRERIMPERISLTAGPGILDLLEELRSDRP